MEWAAQDLGTVGYQGGLQVTPNFYTGFSGSSAG